MIKVTGLEDAAVAIADAVANQQHLSVQSMATKSALGRDVSYDSYLDVSAFTGIKDYQPDELILTVRAGTPMHEVEAVLASANQMLAFEAPDLHKLLGAQSAGTIGGVLATNASGPRRLTAGAARDYLLGFDAISGRGERFKSGGKVMKNVTGYDLSKLICGSYGTLAVFDEVTFKTLPRPETNISLLFGCEDMTAAVAKIASVFASPHEPNAAAILPGSMAASAGIDVPGAMVVIIRLEGIDVSVTDRALHLLAADPSGAEIDENSSSALWQRIRDVELLVNQPGDVWKLSCAPAAAPNIIAAVQNQFDITFFADWAGGLLWLAGPSGASFGTALRTALANNGSGYAQLVRDQADTKTVITPFQPLSSAHYALHKRVKAAFDPLSVLNLGRMHDGI